MAENLVVCIGRQFGSGGHEIGRALASSLGIAFYDKELLQEAARKSGILEELFEKADEKPASALLRVGQDGEAPAKAQSFEDYAAGSENDKIQSVIADVIRDAAEKSPCVIIGRGAAYVLRGRPRMLSVFLHAAPEYRLQRIKRTHNLDEDKARNLIRKMDQSRANFHSWCFGHEWSLAEGYDLTFNSGVIGVEKSVELLRRAVELYCPE